MTLMLFPLTLLKFFLISDFNIVKRCAVKKAEAFEEARLAEKWENKQQEQCLD